MEKRVILNNIESNWTIDETGRLKNINNNNYLKGAINKNYHFYSVYFKGKQYILQTHRLVAEYFIPNPDNLPIVHHKDGNKLNNLVSNLEWISREEHAQTINWNWTKERTSQYFKDDDINEEIAQFRNSPYYATKSGHILNMEKKIIMKEEKTGKYRRVQCYYGLGGKHFSVHRMVWEAFNGEIPKGYQIDHLDANPSNNALDNLALVTGSENYKKANHNQIKVIAKNKNEELHFNSLSDACIQILGYRSGSRQIHKAIAEQKLYRGYYWYYEE